MPTAQQLHSRLHSGKSGASWVCTFVQLGATNGRLAIAFERLRDNDLRSKPLNARAFSIRANPHPKSGASANFAS
jgi:hypothetical protein